MKKFFLLVLFIISMKSNSQIKFKLFTEKINGGYLVYADNKEYCPVSVKIDFSLRNMTSIKGNHKIFVVPPRTNRILISELKSIKKGRYGYGYKSKFYYGNLFLKTDTSYVYSLPFKTTDSFTISQGYFGKKTHSGERSLDFSLPIGTPVYASREGVVVKVVDNNTQTCDAKKCAKFNNIIIIYHKDGSFSNYVHIDTHSAQVKIGQQVFKGQQIAKSGNIGWSSGPHLHFSVYKKKYQ